MERIFKSVGRYLNPKSYILYVSLISIGGFLNGYVPNILSESYTHNSRYDTGSIGAVTTMPQFNDTISNLTPILHGFTVSLIMITGALPSLFTGALGDRYGQLYVIMAGALIFTIGVTLEGGAHALPMFLVGRALAGFGQGVWISNVSV
jgi:MFS family permease